MSADGRFVSDAPRACCTGCAFSVDTISGLDDGLSPAEIGIHRNQLVTGRGNTPQSQWA